MVAPWRTSFTITDSRGVDCNDEKTHSPRPGERLNLATPLASATNLPWYKELNRRHWFVLVVASLGWLFDTMDQQLFNLARRPAIVELLGAHSANAATTGAV